MLCRGVSISILSLSDSVRKQDNKESNVKASGKPEDPPKKEKGSKGDSTEKASDKKKQDFAKGLSKVYESIRNSILSKTYKISLPKGGLQNYLRVRQYAKGIQPEEGENTEGHRFKRSDIDNSKIVQSPFTSNDRISHGPGVSDRLAKEAGATKPKTTPAESDAKDSAKNPGDPDQSRQKSGRGKASASGQENLTVNESASDDVELYYIYFGDLVAAFVEQPHINERMKDENYNIILGQIFMSEVLRGTDNGDPPIGICLNLGDLPIALDQVNAWFTDVFVKPQVSSMTLYDVIRNMVNRLLVPMLNIPDTIRGGDIPRTRTIEVTHFESARDISKNYGKGSPPIALRHMLSKTDSFPKLNMNTPTSKGKKFNYIVIATNPEGFYMPYTGNEGIDEQFGLMHYFLAKDKGLLKSASFKKESIPGAREMNVADEASDQNTNAPRFWEPYAVDLELFGNPYLEPYTMFFLNPTAPGMGGLSNKDSPASRLNIGGYFSITGIENSISDGAWTSSVTATKSLGTNDISGNSAADPAKLKHKPIS